MAIPTLSQVMSPISSTTSTTQRLLQRSSRMNLADTDTEPSYSCDAELDDELTGKALSSPLFTQEREEPSNLRQNYHSHEKKVCCQLSPFSHVQVGETRARTKFRFVSKTGRNQVATWKTSKSGISLKEKNSKFLLTSYLRSRSTNFKPILTEEVSRN